MISKTLPHADHFEPVAPTKEPINFAELLTIDLATYEDGREAREQLAQDVLRAMTTQGFFYLANHGLSEVDITRQVDIGHHVFAHTSDGEKRRLQAPILEKGSYFGFKPRGHWRTAGTVRDRIENFNVYRDVGLHEQPGAVGPFLPEIREVVGHTHRHILYRLLHLFGIALRLDDEEYLVKVHDYDGHDESWFRYMKYYDEFTEEEREEAKGLWFFGHQDLGSLTILFSQPMTSLQVRDYESSEWKYVKHLPGGAIVNAGELMRWWTGDYFKAAIHRVTEPPEDQRGHDRCSTFYFAVPNDDVVINTLLDRSPVLREAGVKMTHKPEDAPTSKEWCNSRIKITGRNAVWDQKEEETNAVVEKVGKVTTSWFR